MVRRKLIVAAALLATVGTALYAATPAEKIAERQEAMKSFGRANKAIRDELAKKTAPDFAVVQNNARALLVTAQRSSWMFGRGTGPQTGVKTAALPIIWTQFADFRAKNVAFVNAARALDDAARAGDAAQVRTAQTALGATCKSCHDTYRKPA